MGLMPTMNNHGFWLRSRGWELLLQKRLTEKRHITIDEVAEACKVSLSTARRYVSEQSISVSQSENIASIEIAQYFGVAVFGTEDSLLVRVNGDEPARPEKRGSAGRPRKDEQ